MASRVTCGSDEGVSVAIASNPGTELDHLRQIEGVDVETIRRRERLRDFAIQAGERFKDGDVVVVEAHLDFVVDGWTPRAHFVRLPQAGDFGEHELLEAAELLFRDGNVVKRFKKVADAPALEHDGAAGDFRWMGGEDGHDEYALEPVESFFGGDADAAHLRESAGQGTALTTGVSAEAKGDAAALAVVRFGKIDELEVERKGPREQDGALRRKGMNQIEGDGRMACGFFGVATGFGIAAANGSLAQSFDMSKQVVACLLAQYFAKQCAQGAYVATQGSFFQVTGLRFQFGQPLCPVFRVPKKSHRLSIMPDGA